MTMSLHIGRYQSRYKIYKTSNHSIESSCLRPEAQQGLPHLNGSFASRLKIHKDDWQIIFVMKFYSLNQSSWFNRTVPSSVHKSCIVPYHPFRNKVVVVTPDLRRSATAIKIDRPIRRQIWA
jgi:hypothetical protein